MAQGRSSPLSMRQHHLLPEAASVRGHRSVTGLSSVGGAMRGAWRWTVLTFPQ